jgi:ABC-type antimicrobial peptide transport system permease subunit
MPEAFLLCTILESFLQTIMVHTAVRSDSMLPAINQQVWAVDLNVKLFQPGSLESDLQRYTYANPRFEFIMLATFAGAGVFSVMAYNVSLQTHAIGIRMAFGAQRNDILRMVLKKGFALITAGIIIGVVSSLGLTRSIANSVWGLPPNDPWTFSVVAVAIAAIGLAACFLPARRVTQVDPLVALRYE